MAVPAFAEEVTYKITINNSVGTYEAYQIFKGDLAGNVLSNIEWGTGVTEAGKTAFGKMTAAEVAKTLDNETAAKAFATKISGYLDTTAAVEGKTEITGLSAGYYLIKNESVNPTEAYTDFILEVVKDVQITPKGQKPTLDKQIKHNESGQWGDEMCIRDSYYNVYLEAQGGTCDVMQLYAYKYGSNYRLTSTPTPTMEGYKLSLIHI